MSAPPPGPVTDLPIGATVASSYRTFVVQLRYLPKAMAVPFLLSILLWIATLMIVQLGTFFQLLALIPYTLFGVTWYRLNLYGPVVGAPVLGLSWGKEHWRFLRFVILVTLLNMVGFGIVISPMAAAGPAASLGVAAFTLCGIVALAFVLVRVSFVFPAAAVGEVYGFKHAWRHSVGQGWRLLLGVILVLLPLLALMGFIAPIISAPLLEQIPETGGTAGELATPEELGATLGRFQLIQVILEYPMLALIMTYVSIAFQTCTGWVPDQPNLPAAPDEPDDA
ncbi:MAG: hypothetical protein AAF495_24855 [Pseudomonadota bacterium]